jgi:RND family efflux transporter MFP subunit
MKTDRNRIILTLKALAALIALGIIMLWVSGILRDRVDGGSITAQTGQPIPPGGHIITLQIEEIPDYVTLSGTVHSEQQINLSARLPAYVETVHVKAGDRVPEGHLLMALDQRELREELAAAQARLEQAETAFRRSERLLETNATTPQAHESAESNFRAARAQAERVHVMLTYTRIQAPIDGIVSDRFVEAGDLAYMGQSLLTIFDPTRLRIEVPVPASLIHLFPVGATFPATVDQEKQQRTGTVTEVVSAFDPVTRTRRVKLRLDETGDTLLPGMYGQVIVATGTTRGILLPPHAIERVGQLESVMVENGNRLQRRLVRTGPAHDGRICIISGLHAGDRVWIPGAAETTGEGASDNV